MTEAFFFQRRGGLTLREIAALTGAVPQRVGQTQAFDQNVGIPNGLGKLLLPR